MDLRGVEPRPRPCHGRVLPLYYRPLEENSSERGVNFKVILLAMNDKFLLTGLFSAGILLWVFLNARAPRYDFRTKIDSFIPFVPWFSFVYLSIFIFIPAAAAFLFFSPVGEEYLLSMVVGLYAAAVPWYFFPGKTYRPVIEGKGISKTLALAIYNGNPHANTFPSIHVFTSLLTAYFLSIVYPAFTLFFFIAAAAVSLSTVLIKQHHAVDVIAGILWAAASIAAARALMGF